MSLTFDRWPLTRRSTGWGTGRPVLRGWEFKTPPYTLHFSHFLLQSLPSLHIIASRRFFDQISDRLQVEDLIFGRICARVLVWNPGFHLLRASSLCTARLRAASSFLLSFSLWAPFSPFVSLDGTTERDGHFQGSGQAPCWAISAQADGGSLKGEVWHSTLQFEWGLSALEAKICSEESHPKEKCQFLPTSALRVWGAIRTDGMAALSEDLWAGLPDSGAGFLFSGDLWAWRTRIIHYERRWDPFESREHLPHSRHPFDWTPCLWGQGVAHCAGIWA